MSHTLTPKVVRVLAPSTNCNLRYGACIYKPFLGGWIFVPNVPGRRASRKARLTAEAAVPRWAKPNRMVAEGAEGQS